MNNSPYNASRSKIFEKSLVKVYKTQNKSLALALQNSKLKIKNMKSEQTRLKIELEEAKQYKIEYESLKAVFTTNISLLSVADYLMKINKSIHEASKKLKILNSTTEEISLLNENSVSNMKKVRNSLSETVAFMEAHNDNELITSILPRLTSLNDSLKIAEYQNKKENKFEVRENPIMYHGINDAIFEDSKESNDVSVTSDKIDPVTQVLTCSGKRKPSRRLSRINTTIEYIDKTEKDNQNLILESNLSSNDTDIEKRIFNREKNNELNSNLKNVPKLRPNKNNLESKKPQRKSKLSCLKLSKEIAEKEKHLDKFEKNEDTKQKKNRKIKKTVKNKSNEPEKKKVKKDIPKLSVFSFSEENTSSSLCSSNVSQKEKSFGFKEYIENLL